MADIAALQSRVTIAEQELTRAEDHSSQRSQELIELMRSIERVIKGYRERIEQQSATIARQSDRIARLDQDKTAWNAERTRDAKRLARLSSERDKLSVSLHSLLTAIESQQPNALGELIDEIRDRIAKLGEHDQLVKLSAAKASRDEERVSSAEPASDFRHESRDTRTRHGFSDSYSIAQAPSVDDLQDVPPSASTPICESGPCDNAAPVESRAGGRGVGNSDASAGKNPALIAIDRRIKELLDGSSDAGGGSGGWTDSSPKTTPDSILQPGSQPDSQRPPVRSGSLRHISASPDHTEYRFWFWPKAEEEKGGQQDSKADANLASRTASEMAAGKRKTA